MMTFGVLEAPAVEPNLTLMTESFFAVVIEKHYAFIHPCTQAQYIL